MDRPTIFSYRDPLMFVIDMIRYRKQVEPGFSVLKSTKKLRRLSPALVSLILKGKRRLTVDRADDFCQLLGLNAREKIFFKDWLDDLENRQSTNKKDSIDQVMPQKASLRRQVSSHLLADWINVYVKDAVRLRGVRQQKSLIYKLLGGIASQVRIDKSIKFLLREGYLRINEKKEFVEDTPLMVTSGIDPQRLVRKFHKQTLNIAKRALDLYPVDERYANALVMPVNQKNYQELIALVSDFAERLQSFAEKNNQDDERLYQLIIHVSPTGGKSV